MSDSELRRDRNGVAAVISVLLAGASVFVFVSVLALFLFPAMPVGAWLGWKGRDSRYEALGWIGFIVCATMSAYFLFILVVVTLRGL